MLESLSPVKSLYLLFETFCNRGEAPAHENGLKAFTGAADVHFRKTACENPLYATFRATAIEPDIPEWPRTEKYVFLLPISGNFFATTCVLYS